MGVPAGPSGSPLYATIAQVRGFGLSATKTDQQVLDAIDQASRVMDDYCDEQFYQTTETVLVNDVRLPMIRLPKLPFTGITEVKINAMVLDPSAYTVEKWGLRLYTSGNRDADGWPLRPLSSFGTPTFAARYGSQVSVSATFGHPSTPANVNRACVILSSRIAVQGGNSLIPDTRLKSLTVEGYSRTWDSSTEKLDTTGDTQVDRLLRAYRHQAVQVG